MLSFFPSTCLSVCLTVCQSVSVSVSLSFFPYSHLFLRRTPLGPARLREMSVLESNKRGKEGRDQFRVRFIEVSV